MDIILNHNLGKDYLEKADIIKITNPNQITINKPHLFLVPADSHIDAKWRSLPNTTLGLTSVRQVRQAKELDIPFYFSYPLSTPDQVRAAYYLGAKRVKITGPAFFYIKQLREAYPDLIIQTAANIAYEDGLPRPNGLTGSWINPKDIELYEPYLDAIEFDGVEQAQEETLFRIYTEPERWGTDLNLIIKNLDYEDPIPARYLTPDFTHRRLKCGQLCAIHGLEDNHTACNFCAVAAKLATVLKDKPLPV